MSRMKVDAQGSATGAKLQFMGAFSRDCGERTRFFSVLGHPQYVHALFTQLWREMGGTFAGGLREGIPPAAARRMASLQSPSLSEVVRDVNKYSNNVMARHLYLTLGAAMGELRELARGIHPAVLTEGGLGPALETLAARSTVPVRLVSTPDERFGRD